MIRKHHSTHSLIVISLLLSILISGIASAEIGNWIIDDDKIYVDDSKVYLSAEPHTISDSGFVYFTIKSKQYSGNVDLYYGFNSGGLKPTRAYYHNGNEWVNIASQFDKTNYDYDGLDTWYYSNNLPIQAGQNYSIAVWMERANEICSGKYGFAIKPSSQTITQAISAGNFYYLDPWWDSDWSSFSTVTLTAPVSEDDIQVHLSSDDFDIPTKMWDNMDQNGNDTRILHTDNTTVYPIWIEYMTAKDNFSVWVNVTDKTTGDILLWYYGNDTVDSVSSIYDTGVLGSDDFSGDTANWSAQSGAISITDGISSANPSADYGGVRSVRTYSLTDGLSIRTLQQYQDITDTQNAVGYSKVSGATTWYNHATLIMRATGSPSRWESWGKDTTDAYGAGSLDSNWHIINIDGLVGSSGVVTISDESGSISPAWSVEDDAYYIWLVKSYDSYQASHITKTDYIFLYKYNISAPVISNIDLTAVVNTPPNTPTLVSPPDSSYILEQALVELNVSSNDVDGDTITYNFYGGTDPASLSFLGHNDSVNGSSYSWNIQQYDTYYWTASASDQWNTSDTMSVAQFTLLIPPNLTTPSNTSTQYETYPPLTASVEFIWQDIAAPQYRLMIAEDINFNVVAVDVHVGTNNNNQELLVNKEFYWKVYSYDGTTYSDPSDIYNFNLTGNSTLTGSAIEGVVYQSDGAITAIPGAEVTIWNTTWSSSMITGSNGYYVFEGLNSGTVYNLQAKSDRYWDSSIALVSAEDEPVTNNFYLIDDLTDTEWWHYVEFTLQNVWGVTYPGVATNVYIGDSVTVYESGNTGNDGTITFHMDQNIEYRITFINSTLGINEVITLYPVSKSYIVYIDSYSFELPDVVTDDIQAYIVSSRINATYGHINFTWSDISGLTTSINYYISDVDGNLLYSTNNSGPDMFDSQIVSATDDRYIVRYVGVHPTHGIIDETETVVFHGGRGVDFGWPHDWQYAVTALAFLIFIGSMFGAKTAHYGAITVVIFAWIFKWIGWLDETNTSTLLIILAAVIAFGWSLRKSEEVKM